MIDEATGKGLAFARVFVEEPGLNVLADTSGIFIVPSLPAGPYHLRFSHIGCEPQTLFYRHSKDTTIVMVLHHHTGQIDEITVHADRYEKSAGDITGISQEQITHENEGTISEILDQIPGVSLLKNGTSLSKPIVNGISGNRLSILNNGILQAGQQWGTDHAPEIDGLSASRMYVVQGVTALAYPGNSTGSIIVIEPGAISNDPHTHGRALYTFSANGRGHTAHLALEKGGEKLLWRIGGTFRKAGDLKSPTYYLTNTGFQSGNLNVQLENRTLKDHVFKLYYSSFITENGILRGSHIGNLTDLNEAIGRSVPFFTQEDFSYAINAPRQLVHHHVLKTTWQYFKEEGKVWELNYAFQLNERFEFDIRRGGRENIPALSLLQTMHTFHADHKTHLSEKIDLHSGFQTYVVNNTNDPETGILPLIPDYIFLSPGAYSMVKHSFGKLITEAGARYDYRYLDAYTISNDLPRRIERFQRHFHNASLSTAARFTPNRHFSTLLNISYIRRSPEVNELYSYGLHQGVSGIEIGNQQLSEESLLKILTKLEIPSSDKIFVSLQGFFNYFGNYIFLEPQQDFLLTIRGAFPVFEYQQTAALMAGANVSFSYLPFDKLRLSVEYSYLYGRDITDNIPLVFMPPNSLKTSIKYTWNDKNKWHNSFIELKGLTVFEQKNLEQEQDFLAPPPMYFLLSASVGTTLHFRQGRIALLLKGENLLNQTYRDYLNRLRYFADEPGYNIIMTMRYEF